MKFGRSIALRLNLLLAAAAAVVLFAVGQMVIASLEEHFEDADLHELRGKMSLAQRALGKVSSTAELAALPRHLEDALVGHDALEVTVLAADRSVLFATHDATVPAALIGGASGEPPAPPSGVMAWRDGNHAYRGIAAHATTGIAGHPPAVVAIAVRIDKHLRFIADFRKKLWLAIAGGVLATIALAWVAVRMGMAPLRRVTAVARLVTASRLGDRLNVEEVPLELAELARAFNDMLERIEDSVRRLSEFSADLAHELRTPISNLMTETQVALAKPRSAEQYREVLYSNLEEFDRLARMASDMLFLAKADHGLVTPNWERVAIGAEVRDLFSFYEAVAEERGIRLNLKGAGDARGDRLMLRRALSNLLSNAIRHGDPGSSVDVEISSAARTLGVRVTNVGTPIPSEQLGRIFDRFYRGDPSRHRTHEGAGLGLCITKSIVEAHRGHIVAIASGHAMTFEIELPIEPDIPPQTLARPKGS